MCNPPRPGDPSYDQYQAESKALLDSLSRRAKALSEGFNKCKNMTCTEVEGEGAKHA
jgi:glutamate--glyoxylate aminotransferase